MWQQNSKLVESVELKYQLLASNLRWINNEATSLKIKPSEGRQFVEMNNYVYQNEVPRILSREKDTIEKIGERLKDRGGFIVSHRGEFDQIQTELVRQAASLRSTLSMLQMWLKVQRKCMEPSWWRRLFDLNRIRN